MTSIRLYPIFPASNPRTQFPLSNSVSIPIPILITISISTSIPDFILVFVVYHEPTQSFFFCSNAGAPLGFSGLNNSNRVFKISLDETENYLRGEIYLDEETGDWKAGNATLVEISGEDGTEGRLVNVNGGEWVLLSVGVGVMIQCGRCTGMRCRLWTN
jgi:hypothetical protein